MLQILHVVHDDKFIDKQLPRYFRAGFENKIVYLSEKFTYEGLYAQDIKWVKPSSKEFDELVKSVKKFDLVIIYLLNYNKSVFVNKIDKDLPIIWHFFGGEVYHAYKFRNDYYAPATKKILKVDSDLVWKTKTFIKEVTSNIKELLNGKKEESIEFFKAIKRLNYFLWYDKYEYEHIKEKISFMPDFLELPISNKIPEISLDQKKELKIILGNSMVPTNNHFDVLLMLEQADYKGSVLMPCSYGVGKDYFSKLKAQVKNLSLNVKYLEDFIPYQEYIQIIGTCSASIFNSYRQMALGNIFILLTNGVKVYLSEKNTSFYWLKSKGFYIYSIERDLKADIQKSNLILPKEFSLINREKYNDLINPVYTEEFLTKLITITKKNKVAVE